MPDGISDITHSETDLASEQLASAARLWQQRKKELAKTDELSKFTARLDRQFAIESNVIERVFQLDRGVTQVLVDEGIKASLIPHGSTDKPPTYVVDILENALQAQQWLIDRFVTNDESVTTFSIKELHQLLTRSQLTTEAQTPTGMQIEIPLLHGEYKTTDNQVRKEDSVLRYCPPEHVAPQMEMLVNLHREHVRSDIAPEVSAAWLHHRFVQIHPFQDGNGRVARCLASLVFLKAGLFPMIVNRDDTARYIHALERADVDDLGPLVAFITQGQLQRFNQALNIASEVGEQPSTLGLAIASIGDTLKKRAEERVAQQKQLVLTAERLMSDTEAHLKETAEQLDAQGLEAFAARNSSENDYYYQSQAISFAKNHEYFADTMGFRAWVRLKFKTIPATQLLLHSHARGRELGVIVVAPIFEIIEAPQDEGPAMRESLDIVLEPFEFYRTESWEQVKKRFMPWLNETLTLALSQVQRFL